MPKMSINISLTNFKNYITYYITYYKIKIGFLIQRIKLWNMLFFDKGTNFIYLILLIELKIRNFKDNFKYNSYMDDEVQFDQFDELLKDIEILKKFYNQKDIKNYKEHSKVFFDKLNNYHTDWWY